MNKKGFILQTTLYLSILISMMMLSALKITENRIEQLRREKSFVEMYRIENSVIKLIKLQYRFNKPFDFVWYKNGTVITVQYNGDEATLMMSGRYNYIAVITMDSFSKNVLNYYYID